MKEVTAIIRMKMVNKTKEALLKEGFPSMTCLRVMGRGNSQLNVSLVRDSLIDKDTDLPMLVDVISVERRLVTKRMLSMTVEDKDLEKVVATIIEVNRTDNSGDGKIFVETITEAYRVSTGESGLEAI